ncbi:MAG: hypothetical protein ACRC1U_00060 [Vibrionaceae bacterium]
MKKIATLAALASLCLSTAAYSATTIASKDAPFHEGKEVVACGVVKELTRFKRGVYLNMDERFPKQSLTLVVWENDLASFQQKHGALEQFVNKKVCGKGTVTSYRGRSQISLYNSFSLQVS